MSRLHMSQDPGEWLYVNGRALAVTVEERKAFEHFEAAFDLLPPGLVFQMDVAQREIRLLRVNEGDEPRVVLRKGVDIGKIEP